ncbi:flagellar filament capping protein FliD [Massilia sp. PWRC2]|uniref:flagellar filament capping protein FliD n=1 Tax=Massilia sp. PWRC2 TaxID=2804626 RepID=UPI003CEDB9CE
MASSTTAAASTTAANTTTVSTDVAAKVKQALAPAAAASQKVTAALAQGQAKLSGLGQLKSAIADFQTATQSLGSPSNTDKTSSNGDTSSKLQSFVTAFNTLNSKLQSLQKSDLKGDPGLTLASAQVAQNLRNSGPGAGAAALAKAGISIDSSGTMKLDSTKLAAAQAADPAAVNALLAPATGTSAGGIVAQLGGRLGELNSGNGTVAREQASAGKQVSALTTREAAISKTLTAQASALAAFYTQQAGIDGSGTPSSLFDMLA